MQVYSDIGRNLSGIGGGEEGRLLTILNTGSATITLLNESSSSSASNRFSFGSDLVLGPKQSALLRYDGAASRWFAIARPPLAVPATGAIGFHNRVVNASGQINQAGSGSVADGCYWFDQWVHLTQSNPVTPSQVSNAENGTPFMMRTTQGNATAQRFGLLQPLEAANVADLCGQSVTLSARVRMSAATTLRYVIVEWTGTADAVVKDVVNNWNSTTFTAGNFFISSNVVIAASGSSALSANTLTSIALTGTISSGMKNLLVFLWTDAAQAQNVTLDIGKVQLELGSSATPLAVRSIDDELRLCQRYFAKGYVMGTLPADLSAGGRQAGFSWSPSGIFSPLIQYPVRMRVAPAVTAYAPPYFGGTSDTPSSGNWQWYNPSASAYKNASATTALDITDFNFLMSLSVSGATTTGAYIINGNWAANARL